MPLKAATYHIPTFQLYKFFQSQLVFATHFFRAACENLVVKYLEEQIHHRGLLSTIHEHCSQLVQLRLVVFPALAIGLGEFPNALAQCALLLNSILAHSHILVCGQGSTRPSSIDYLQKIERKLMAGVMPFQSSKFTRQERPYEALAGAWSYILQPRDGTPLRGVPGARRATYFHHFTLDLQCCIIDYDK